MRESMLQKKRERGAWSSREEANGGARRQGVRRVLDEDDCVFQKEFRGRLELQGEAGNFVR